MQLNLKSTCVGGLVGFGRGMRRWKMGGELGMDLDREGWEPLLMHLLVLLHPAECRCRGALRSFKGLTTSG